MSQIFKNMNKVGKGIFITGVIFCAISLVFVLSSAFEGRNAIIGVMSLTVGLYYIQWAAHDDRCNINRDTKGNLIQGQSQEVIVKE